MERTPRSCSTRSRAKNKNTPSNREIEESISESPNYTTLSGRRVRRKRESVDIKLKTNGEASVAVDSKPFKNSCDATDNSCESESSVASEVLKQNHSPKGSDQSASPTISRKSLRLRHIFPSEQDLKPSTPPRKRRGSESECNRGNTPKIIDRKKRATSETKEVIHKRDYKENAVTSNLKLIEKIVEIDEDSDTNEDSVSLSTLAKSNKNLKQHIENVTETEVDSDSKLNLNSEFEEKPGENNSQTYEPSVGNRLDYRYQNIENCYDETSEPQTDHFTKDKQINKESAGGSNCEKTFYVSTVEDVNSSKEEDFKQNKMSPAHEKEEYEGNEKDKSICGQVFKKNLDSDVEAKEREYDSKNTECRSENEDSADDELCNKFENETGNNVLNSSKTDNINIKIAFPSDGESNESQSVPGKDTMQTNTLTPEVFAKDVMQIEMSKNVELCDVPENANFSSQNLERSMKYESVSPERSSYMSQEKIASDLNNKSFSQLSPDNDCSQNGTVKTDREIFSKENYDQEGIEIQKPLMKPEEHMKEDEYCDYKEETIHNEDNVSAQSNEVVAGDLEQCAANVESGEQEEKRCLKYADNDNYQIVTVDQDQNAVYEEIDKKEEKRDTYDDNQEVTVDIEHNAVNEDICKQEENRDGKDFNNEGENIRRDEYCAETEYPISEVDEDSNVDFQNQTVAVCSEHYDEIVAIDDSENSDNEGDQKRMNESELDEEQEANAQTQLTQTQEESSEPIVVHFNMPGGSQTVLHDCISKRNIPEPVQVSEDESLKVQSKTECILQDKADNELLDSERSSKDQQYHLQNQQKSIDNLVWQESEHEDGSYKSDGSSDIYKNMSDIGSDDSEHKNKKHLDENETHGSESEEYISSNDDDEVVDEEEEEEEENMGEEMLEEVGKNENEKVTNEKNQESIVSGVKENIQSDNMFTSQGTESKNNENEMGTSLGTLTYDKALEILNKNKEKKIDDEEFFDMFTQELNRVSAEEADSDSDLAIVDEWIPENAPKPKPVIKTIKQLQAFKQAQRAQNAMSRPVQAQLQHFTGHFGNQQVSVQHPVSQQNQHPSHLHRTNFPQETMYNQFGQNISHMNAAREHTAMYQQFGAPPHDLPDHRMFQSHAQHMSYPSREVYDHSQHTHEIDVQFTNQLGARARNRDALGIMNLNNESYADHLQAQSGIPFETKFAERRANEDVCKEAENNFTLQRETGTEKSDQNAPNSDLTKEAKKSNTPILDMLNLNEKALTQLRKELCIEQRDWKRRFDNHNKRERESRVHRSKKNSQREKQKQILRKILNSETAYASSEHSSDRKWVDPMNELTTDDNRFVERVGDGNVIVTFGDARKKKAYRKQRIKKKNRKRVLENSDYSDNFVAKKKNRKNFNDHERNPSSDSDSARDEFFSSAKQPQKKFSEVCSNKSSSIKQVLDQKKQKETSSLKSRIGTFTVESIPSSSSSIDSDDSSSQAQSYTSIDMEDIKKAMKNEILSGKNKLSNIFTQQKHQSKKPETSTKRENTRRPKIRVLRKLPSEVLEKLSGQGEKRKRQQVSSTDSELPLRPRKSRRTKIRVKSAAAEEAYIPFHSRGATQFALSRLDKEGVLSAAQRAAKFKNDHLYGSSVKRITILDFNE